MRLHRILDISIFLAMYKSRVSSQMEVACAVGKSGSFLVIYYCNMTLHIINLVLHIFFHEILNP